MIFSKTIHWRLNFIFTFTRFTRRQFEGIFWGRRLNWKGSRSGPLGNFGRIIWRNVLLPFIETLFWLFCDIVCYDSVLAGRCNRQFQICFILIQRAIVSCDTKISISAISNWHLNGFHELWTLVALAYLCHFGSHAYRLHSFGFKIC
jgi:hypothetical protein